MGRGVMEFGAFLYLTDIEEVSFCFEGGDTLSSENFETSVYSTVYIDLPNCNFDDNDLYEFLGNTFDVGFLFPDQERICAGVCINEKLVTFDLFIEKFEEYLKNN